MFALQDKKKWKPEIKDSWMTFFSSIVKVMKKNEMKVYGSIALGFIFSISAQKHYRKNKTAKKFSCLPFVFLM
jgi:hypothetical protein